MANTYTFINKAILSATATSVTFSSIPSTYTDLKLLSSARTDKNATQNNPLISFNGSSSNFSYRFLSGSGVSATSSSGSSNPINDVNAANSTANTFTNFDIYIPNYASANYKSFSIDSAQETNATGAYAELWAMLWSNTASITSITLNSDANWVSGSSFYLYGIKNS
jgi:hypothetical protein